MDLQRLEGKHILITGATGLIGRAIVELLQNHLGAAPIYVIAAVRDEAKARALLSEKNGNKIQFLVGDIRSLPIQKEEIDYIIHGASMTASRDFVTRPKEVIQSVYEGTLRTLELARICEVKGYVFLSTMEVYGAPTEEDKIAEGAGTNLDTMQPRSSYPESKRLAESLCAAYVSEFGVPAKAVRLTQTFGRGVTYDDGRVFAEFARCVIEKRDIILKTKGETKRSYLYTEDAAEAILTVLLDGKAGEAYNAANEATYCSIYEMACMVARQFGEGAVEVKICEAENLGQFGYAPTLKMNLSSEKLRGLGWRPKTDLQSAYAAMISDMKMQRNHR